MYESDPELITVIEGPTPDFQASPYLWFQSIYEGPEDAEVMMCELRTLNGESILDRCTNAWRQGRPVRLDFPDYLRMRKQLDVVAMRLHQLDEGPMLMLWVRHPADEIEEEGFDEGYDESDDDFGV